MVLRRHPENRADLKHPQLAIIVEVIRNMCCLSILPEYFELRKYNLLELCAPEGGIKVVGEKRERVVGGESEGHTKIVAGKSDEIEEEVTVAKEDVETDPDYGKGDNSKTVDSELKDEANEIKGSVDVDDPKNKSEGLNIEEQTDETGNQNKGVDIEEQTGVKENKSNVPVAPAEAEV
jgi:tRNA acetyltransferase TAN1